MRHLSFNTSGCAHYGGLPFAHMPPETLTATLVPEPTNVHDPHAIQVHINGVMVGFVPAKDRSVKWLCPNQVVGDLLRENAVREVLVESAGTLRDKPEQPRFRVRINYVVPGKRAGGRLVLRYTREYIAATTLDDLARIAGEIAAAKAELLEAHKVQLRAEHRTAEARIIAATQGRLTNG